MAGILYEWHAVAQLVEALHYKPEVRGFDFRWRHLDYGPGVDSASKRNDYRWNLQWGEGVEAAGA